MTRMWLGLALVAALGGCGNRLSTDTAVLGPGDAGPVQMKPGLWRIEDSGCSLRETNKTSDWPNCGRWLLVRERDLVSMEKEADGPVWTTTPYVLAGENALAMQVSEGSGSGDYALYGVRALATGPDGRATRVRRWAISCGLERTTGEKDADGRPITAITPWPGVVMEGDDKCHPAGAEGLLRAAAASETGEKSPDVVLHWVRDGAS